MSSKRTRHTLALPILAGLLLVACCPAVTDTPSGPSPTPPVPIAAAEVEPGWWNDAVFYEIFVRSFCDSDGDGVGDLVGLIQKLDYLNDGDPTTTDDLGITGIWLMPITQSPSYHGYDVVDYYQVDDEYGTNADFLRLMEEAHARGIRVIVDLVINHTSNQHPWFQEALDPNSERRDWYIWSDEPLGVGWHGVSSGFYYGLFSDKMPDLNYENPAVTEAMQDVARFWLEDMGVDGFRLDAAKHLIEDGLIVEHTPATHAWLAGFRVFYKGINPDAFVVGEVWSTTDDAAAYIGEVDAVFEFDLAKATLESAVSGRAVNVARKQQLAVASYPAGQYATFLANHDQNRARSRLLDDEQAKVAATLQLTFPGVPFIYYGEEIGMQGTKPDENIRRPMQWGPGGGFTTAEKPWHAYYEDYQERHVAGQSSDPNSLLNHYRSLIHLRNTHTALRVGSWLPIEASHQSVCAYLRVDGDEIILVLVNLDNDPVGEYNLTLPTGPLASGLQPKLLMGTGEINAPQVNESGGFTGYQPIATLPPRSSFIIQLVP